MAKAWERELEIRQAAIPRILTEEDQTWDLIDGLRQSQDAQLKLLWYSEVPGSGAPECLMLAAVQSAENRGLDVSTAEPILDEALEAFRLGDMARVHGLTSRLLKALAEAPVDQASPYWRFTQVQTWEEHQGATNFPAAIPVNVMTGEYAARVYAGWLAQICGGALGTALEGYTATRIAEVFGDVTGYVRDPNTYNDDITFEIAFLEAYAARGHGVTSADIAEQWVALIPFGWSAEHIALQNLKLGVYPPESGTRSNPFCEWIGAQMRGAVCGLVAPGDAREAARLAWVDGVISHSGNGVLGECFNAMITALAFVRQEMRPLVEETAALIPASTEYRWVLDQALAACREAGSPRAAWDRCEKLLEQYNWVHAYPNAAAQIVALWFGDGDFDETMRLIAMCGQDVDCNAAQIATVIGVMRGEAAIPARWREPVGDLLQTYVRDRQRMSIRALAEQTVAAVRQHWAARPSN
ncbi:MAG: ADP-ribosylglycohydrolase family protein [Bacillota bacterium]